MCGVKTRVKFKRGVFFFEGMGIRKELGYQIVIPPWYLGSARALESGVQVSPVSSRTDILARCLRTRPGCFDKQVLFHPAGVRPTITYQLKPDLHPLSSRALCTISLHPHFPPVFRICLG